MGPSLPSDQLTIQSGFDLFRRKLRINVLGRQQGRRRDLQSVQLPLRADGDVSRQVEPGRTNVGSGAQRRRNNGSGTTVGSHDEQVRNFGYYENGQFWRLREVSASCNLPDAWAQKARAQNASLTLGVTQSARVDEVHG